MKRTIAPSKAQTRRDTMRQTAIALANIRAIEAQPYAPEAPGNALVPGEVYLANESVFTQQYFDEPLTSYAVGWKDPNNIDATLEFFAPATPTARRFTYKEWNNVEEFLAEGTNDDLRQIGADFPLVKYSGTETHARTDNRGLRIRVDLDEVGADSPLGGGMPAYQQRAVAKIMRRMARSSLRRAVALISAAATNTAKTWDTTAGKNPDQDVRTDLIAAATASGIRPTRIGYGDTAWDKRLISYGAQNTAAGYGSYALTPQELGQRLGAEVLVSKERYSAAGAALAEILSNLVFMFNAMSGSDIRRTSSGS